MGNNFSKNKEDLKLRKFPKDNKEIILNYFKRSKYIKLKILGTGKINKTFDFTYEVLDSLESNSFLHYAKIIIKPRDK